MELATVKFDDNKRPYHGTDKNLFVEFYNVRENLTKQLPNLADPNLAGEVEALTGEDGNILYKDVAYVRISSPGNSTSVVDRRVKLISDVHGKADNERFPIQWGQFKSGQEQKASGHDLSEIGLGTREIQILTQAGIHTVEQFVNIPDAYIGEVMLGGRSYQDKARIWLEKKADTSAAVEEQSKTIAKQGEMIAELTRKLEAFTSGKHKNNGDK